MHLDGTPASNPLGGVSSKPLVITIGNFDMDLSNGDGAKRHICYFPDMKGSKAQQSKEKFKFWKRKLYHRRVWAEVL
jgi:hypothetical protein